MTPHPQGNGKPGDVAESEREKPVLLQFRVIDGGVLYGGWQNTDEDGFACARAQPGIYEVRALYATPQKDCCRGTGTCSHACDWGQGWNAAMTQVAATPQPAIPPGFKVVEPTDEMIEAAVQAAWQEERTRISRRVMCDAIKAALSAAPVPEAGQGVSETKQRLRTVPAQFFIDMDSAMRHVECFGSDDAKAVVSTIRNIGAMWLSPAPAQAQAQAQAPVAPPANWRELLGEQPVSTPPQSAQLIEPANGLEKGSAVCPTLHGNLLEIEPNDRRHQEGNRGTGEEEQRGADGERGDAVRTGSAESGARGGNAVQHEVAEERGTGNGAAGFGLMEGKDAVRVLIERAQRQLRAWHAKYGEHQPQWLPPGSDVRWLEDAAAFLSQGQQTEQGSRNG